MTKFSVYGFSPSPSRVYCYISHRLGSLSECLPSLWCSIESGSSDSPPTMTRPTPSPTKTMDPGEGG